MKGARLARGGSPHVTRGAGPSSRRQSDGRSAGRPDGADTHHDRTAHDLREAPPLTSRPGDRRIGPTEPTNGPQRPESMADSVQRACHSPAPCGRAGRRRPRSGSGDGSDTMRCTRRSGRRSYMSQPQFVSRHGRAGRRHRRAKPLHPSGGRRGGPRPSCGRHSRRSTPHGSTPSTTFCLVVSYGPAMSADTFDSPRLKAGARPVPGSL